LWCCYRLLHLHLPLPTIVITIITILNGLHNPRPERNPRARPQRSRLSLSRLAFGWTAAGHFLEHFATAIAALAKSDRSK
jgi:hypothetical protein